MNRRRAKRIRRWLVLTAAIAGVGGIAAVVTHQRAADREAGLQALKRAGINAYAVGDYATTLAKLDPYLAVHDDDADALLPFAVARSKIETPDGQNIRQALRSLDQLLQVRPHDAVARHTLISLLPQSSDTDFIDHAIDDALADDANDLEALKARVVVRIRQDRAADALNAALAVAKMTPGDLESHVTVLRLMDRLHRPAADMKAYADAQFATDDARREVLQATAAFAAGDLDAARKLVSQAVDPTPADAAVVRQAVELFDLLGQYDRSRDLLNAAAPKTKDAGLALMLANRLWQAGDVRRLVDAQPPFDSADPNLLGLRAASLYQAGRTGEAQRIVADLSHAISRTAAAWAIALPARFSPTGTIADLQRASDKDPDNAVIHAWLAARLAATNEPAMALRHWQAAGTIDPAWVEPRIGQAETLIAIGCTSDAVAAAQAAFDRNPGVAGAVRLIGVRYAAYDQTGDSAAARDLLDAIDRVQAFRPNEPATLAVKLSLLCRLGRRDEARSLFATATFNPAIDANGHAILLSAAQSEGLADARMSAAGDLIASAATTRPATDDPAARQARIEALHAVAGDEGRQWRLEQARLWIDSLDPVETTKAVGLLSDLVREAPRDPAARLELARALVNTGNAQNAIDHLRLAMANDPQSPAPLARLVTLLRDQNRPEQAADLLRRSAMLPGLAMRMRLAVASLSLDGGDPKLTVDLLSPLAQTLPNAGRLALAEAYARTGQTDLAVKAFGDLLSASPSAAALAAAAEFQAGRGDLTAARALLTRLDDSPVAMLAKARFELRFGSVDASPSLLVALTSTASGRQALRVLAAKEARSVRDAAAWLDVVDLSTPTNAWPERAASAVVWAAIGRKFNDQATIERSLTAASAVVDHQPADMDIRMLQAGLLQQLNHPKEAEAALRQVLQNRPDSAAANNDLACLLIDQHRNYDDAERLARAAVGIAPNRAAFYDTLGRVLAATNHPADAKAAFETALRLDPALQPAREGLAQVSLRSVE